MTYRANGLARPRILLTGVTGQLGQELGRVLPSIGELYAPVRCDLDLASTDEIRRVVRQTQPGLIVNAAAYTAVDLAESNRELAIAINGTAPGVLAEEAKRCGAPIVHYSTDYVFSGSGSRPWTEHDSTGPVNVYGESKLMGELAVVSSGAAHLTLRTSWVYGHDRPNFVATMLRLGARETELAVVDDQIGAPTSALALAEATALILTQRKRQPADVIRESGGLYHACCAGEVSWCGFAREIFRIAQLAGYELALREVRPIATSEYPTAAKRPLNSRLDCERLNQRLAIRLPDWRQELKRFLMDGAGPAETRVCD